MIDNEVIDIINSKILSYSGINLAESQKPALDTHIKRKAAEKCVTPKEYCMTIEPHTREFDEIINLVTVNETYFFREEKQFDFLKNEVFPKYIGKSITLWTCCCSTGEEPISLMAMALSMGVKLTIYASDIDDNALATLKAGRYSLFSLRTDGKKYHELLEPYSKRTDTEIIFDRDFLNNIHAFKFNLIQDTESMLPFYENAEIIFMRNVFIYFDKPTRVNVTRKVTQRLKDEGLLFFSMNEIGSIDHTIIPDYLSKTNHGVVYYFVRGKREAPVHKIHASEKKKEEEKRDALMKEKLRLEIEKAKILRDMPAISALRNIGAEKEEVPKIDFKNLYEQICAEISRHDFAKARSVAQSISGEQFKRYSFFMQGYVEYYADNRSAAETFFSYAEAAAKDFWPAYFYHGMVLRDMGKADKASWYFKKCRELLIEFGPNNPYDFTLDSFSPSYICSLCNTFQGGE